MKIINLLALLCLVLLLNSCATIYLDKYYVMNVYSDKPDTKVIINNITYVTPAKAVVARSKEKLKVQVLQNDTIANEMTVKPHINKEYWFGNIFCMGLAGYLIDLTTEKRFSYGKKLYLDTLGNVTSAPFYSQKYADLHLHKYKQGDYNLILAIPEVNFFHLQPKGEQVRNMGGFMGVALGGEYFYKDNKSLQLRGDAIIDFLVPFPAAVDYFAPYESCTAVNLNLTDNFHFNRFSVAYGLNFAQNTWLLHGGYNKMRRTKNPNILGKSDTKNMLGVALSAYYRVTNHFYFGVIYRPSFLELKQNPNFMYEQTISFDFMWKIGK